MYFRNYLGHSKKRSGVYLELCCIVEGFVCEYHKGQGCFCIKAKGWRVLLAIRRKGRGLWAKCPLLPTPSMGKQRRRAQGAGGLGPAALGLGGGHGEGGKREEAMGNPLPTSIWAGAQRGGGATEAGGWRAAALWRRRCGMHRRPGSGGRGRGGGEGPFPLPSASWGAVGSAWPR